MIYLIPIIQSPHLCSHKENTGDVETLHPYIDAKDTHFQHFTEPHR